MPPERADPVTNPTLSEHTSAGWGSTTVETVARRATPIGAAPLSYKSIAFTIVG